MKLDNKMQLLVLFTLTTSLITVSQGIITTGVVYLMSDFSVSSTQAQWSYSAFLLVVGVMIPLSAFISRRFNSRTIFFFSLIMFLLGSVVCYFSNSLMMLIIGRVFQAIGNGVLMPYVQILLLRIIPEEKWQTYMGLYGLVVAIAPVVGSFIGGFVITLYGWRALFSFFTIASIIIIVLGLIRVKDSTPTEEYPLDYLSVILSVVGCGGVMLGFTNVADYGFTHYFVIAPIIVGIIALILFVRRQPKLDKPLINLSILKNKYFSVGTIFVCILFFALNGCTALVPIFIQGIAYNSAIISASVLFPGGLLIIAFNFIGPLLTNRIGIKKVLIMGCVLSIIGFATMMFYTQDSSFEFMMITQSIRYIGSGLALMPATTWALTMVSDKVEDGTAVNNTLRQIFAAIGSSMVVVMVAVLAGGNIDHNFASVIAFNQTSLILLVLHIIMLILVIVYIEDKEKIENTVS
ncbi:MAG: DHA2 family efflux MFS transporter permease subunit [Methanobrevibacter sp.]|uniref:DHA2 family efflux MFS transporter permease subunit n=1 Tax=Methanobrevibacter sp. TaxID=66852 RepID=UPI0025F30B47|nr:DHA2 family efflux MFS transporter permease subunit [Methanobrevibacter sp.]MBQ6099132.1 DHA2 family efflux MFS transporter permease subunit [Methanobrevibacter sp.]